VPGVAEKMEAGVSCNREDLSFQTAPLKREIHCCWRVKFFVLRLFAGLLFLLVMLGEEHVPLIFLAVPKFCPPYFSLVAGKK